MSSLVKVSNTLRLICSIIKDESLCRKRASCEKKTKNWIFEALFCENNCGGAQSIWRYEYIEELSERRFWDVVAIFFREPE